MTEENSRAEFEQFASQEYGVTTLRRSPTRPDRYVDMYLQRYWEVWQAAREGCPQLGSGMETGGWRRVGWWVVFDEPNDIGEIPGGFFVDDVRAQTFGHEPGWGKNHLEPCWIDADRDGAQLEKRMQFSEETVTDAVASPGFNLPPYHVEGFKSGQHCVINANGFNCLTFRSKPGAVFTSRENAVEIVMRWNAGIHRAAEGRPVE